MPTSIHILGICGTFMAGIAQIACQLGYKVTGADKVLAPPMSDQLKKLSVQLTNNLEEFSTADKVLIGNVFSRGETHIENILNDPNSDYQSAPEWLFDNVLTSRKVIAISGTHGKTTTTAMVAWILDQAGLEPGFLIGGIAENFGVSAKLGNPSSWFVIEADEYDTAFFDKRPKFLHYQPDILLINNLEFDHADIFQDLASIQKQFHYLLRQLSGNATIIYPDDKNILEVINKGCWSKKIQINEDWNFKQNLFNQFELFHQDKKVGENSLNIIGEHNYNNALAAIVIAYQIGIDPIQSLNALSSFKNVKRRMEIKETWTFNKNTIRLIDDFAHHPTAIKKTLEGLKTNNIQNQQQNTIIALLDVSSNSMKMGVHKKQFADALLSADLVFVWQNSGVKWNVKDYMPSDVKSIVLSNIEQIITLVMQKVQNSEGNIDIIMLSNGQFSGMSNSLEQAISNKFSC